MEGGIWIGIVEQSLPIIRGREGTAVNILQTLTIVKHIVVHACYAGRNIYDLQIDTLLEGPPADSGKTFRKNDRGQAITLGKTCTSDDFET